MELAELQATERELAGARSREEEERAQQIEEAQQLSAERCNFQHARGDLDSPRRNAATG